MFQYLVKRLLLLFVTLFGITAITFVLTRLTPGDPAAMRIQGSSGGASQAVGGYDALVELNRRNLGLDKPMLLNLNFEDREYLARRALIDYLRDTEFWKKDGERRLGRVSTIALRPALEMLKTLNDGGRIDTDRQLASVEEQQQRLVAILPRLAAQTDLDSPGAPSDACIFWNQWLEENAARFDNREVEKTVGDYLQVDDPSALQRQVYQLGGFAVPFLINRMDAADLENVRRVNRALQAQTGLTFVVDESKLEEDRGLVTQRWRSWWRRERIAYTDFSALGDAWNVVANTQFGLWISQAAHFDFGDSYIKRRPVIRMIAEALPVSALISGMSILISYLIAIPLGIFSAVKRYTPADNVITVILFVLYSLPSFWVAGILLLTMTGPPMLDWFPARGLNSDGVYLGADGVTFGHWFIDRLWHLVLPVTCLTYGSLAFLSRQMRSAMLETINQDYIRTAQAKGLPSWSVIMKHALRNSLIPILTISAGLLPELIAGAIIIESIFTIPGMGTLTFEAIVNRDYPVINAVLFFSAFLTLLGILIADLSYAFADPRITYS